MPLGYPIEPIIRKTLDKKRKVLSRTKTSDPFSPRDKTSKEEYQKNIIKTTYIFMVSAPIFEEDEIKRGEMPSGTIMLGNQEYSKNTPEQVYGKDLYNSRSETPYRPTAGVTSLSSEFISSNNVQFIRHITINWSCFSLEDLEELGERFLTLGRKVYVEWGWTQDKKDRPVLIDDDGKVVEMDDTDNRESEATRLRRKVIEVGEGDFDATVGWINNFSWTSREDGGFDCITEITVQGVNALDGPTDINDNQPGQKKFRENPVSSISGFSFGQALMDLPKKMFENIENGADPDDKLKSYRYQLLESYQTATSVEESFDEGGRWRSASTTLTFGGVKEQDQGIYTDSKNFIVTENKVEEMNQALEHSTTTDYLSSPGINFDADNILDGKKYEPWWDKRTEYPPEKSWVRWGWFEDNILNKFFALIDESGNPVSYFRSVEDTGKSFSFAFQQVSPDKKVTTSDPNTSYSGDYVRTTKDEQGLGKDYKGYSEAVNFKKNPKLNTGKSYIDYRSIMVKSHKDFKTRDINKFIFPGKFELEMNDFEKSEWNSRLNKIEAERDEFLKKLGFNDNKTFDPEKAKNDQERQWVAKVQSLNNELDAINEYGGLLEFNMDEVEKKIQEHKITANNFDLTKTGLIPYYNLSILSKICQKKIQLPYKFEVPNSKADNKGFTKGYLRNIFINVKHLQDIFSNKSATLGENMNALFDSITMETGGMIDLVVIADNNEVGCLKTQQRGYDKNESEKIKKLENNPGLIYEFPVWQNDSFVKSQELSSDISGENYKILLSKSYDERIKLEKKKGISLIHHANINSLDSKGNIKPEEKQYESIGKGITPAFTVKGYENYGEPEGYEDYPLGKDGASVVPEDIIEQAEIDIRTKARKQQTEKNLERRDSIFKEAPIYYTADGRLKGDIDNTMKDKLKLREIKKVDSGGKEYTIVLPNIDDYGMVGITNSLNMTGIAGIYPSNLFTTTYLPSKFKEHSHFYATDVGQSIDSSDWTTTIEGRMVWKYVEVAKEGDFSTAFSIAKKAGMETFVWSGKTYTTELADE
jgi:hypothetical protein